MSPTQFAISLPHGAGVPLAASEAERLGFDYVSSGEHLAFHGPPSNSLISLSAAAGATSRIGLLSAVTLVPLYPAAVLAKLVASLDAVSAGRFHLGVGVGGENPVEFEAAGVPVAERGARMDESLDLLHRLLGSDEVTFRGRYTTTSRSVDLAPTARDTCTSLGRWAEAGRHATARALGRRLDALHVHSRAGG
jgi:alkanesulfonate monooxygenase SsuD/methylene tetrahydromethanopterin reductase-like flavin-dependent oxidoreductase (luciferase family)